MSKRNISMMPIVALFVASLVMALTVANLLAVFLMVIVIGVVAAVLYAYNSVRDTCSAYKVASRRGWLLSCPLE